MRYLTGTFHSRLIKTKRVKRQNQPAWMTKEILLSRCCVKARNTKLSDDWTLYTRAKCKTTNLIRKIKRNYFREKVDENKRNPKGIWTALRTFSRTDKSQIKIKELNTKSGTVYNQDSVANALNDFFINILEQLGDGKIPDDTAFDVSKLRNFVSAKLDVHINSSF